MRLNEEFIDNVQDVTLKDDSVTDVDYPIYVTVCIGGTNDSDGKIRRKIVNILTKNPLITDVAFV